MHGQQLGGGQAAPDRVRDSEEGTDEVKAGICVLGVPRGGTSLAAGVLHGLGVFLGEEEDLREPDAANPLGYWELPELTALNEELLAQLGGGEDSIPALPSGWEDSPELEPLRERARALVGEHFGGASSWGWKDPRASVTLPFWKQIVGDPRFVICVRNPLDAAQSMRATAAGGAELEPQMSTWLQYAALALEHTSGCPRMVVDYDDFLDQPRPTARRLARFAGLADDLADADVSKALAGIVDPSLALFRTPPELSLEDERVSREAAALYKEVRRLRDGDSSRDEEPEVRAREWQSVDRLARRLRMRGQAEQTDADGSEALNGHAAERVAELEELLGERERAVAEERAKLSTVEEERDQERAAIEESRRVVAELEQTLAGERSELEAERARARELERALGDSRTEVEQGRARIGELESAAEQAAAAEQARAREAEAAAERQQRLLNERDGSIRDLQARIAELERVAARELENVADRDQRLVTTQSELAELLGHVERLKAAVEERDARLLAQKQFLQEQRDDLQFRDAQHQQIIRAMRQSRSWRMTKPYRRTAIFMRGITGRGDPDLKP